MNNTMKRLILLVAALLLISGSWAQNKNDRKLVNWYNKDLKKDKVFGVSTEKTYKELLKNKTSKPVIVAVIDGGTDINHEDLKANIWTNPAEVAGNGIDDDHNGYTDDVHGWNFIGNAKGEDVQHDNLEVTRLYRELDAKYKDADEKNVGNEPAYKLYKKVRSEYLKKSAKADDGAGMEKIIKDLKTADSTIRIYTGKQNYTNKDLKKLKKAPENVKNSAYKIKFWSAFGIKASDILTYADQIGSETKYHYNLDYDPRSIVGDDYKDNSNRIYGNNDVKGPDPGHGTFVAGEIGAVRNNGVGINGIADNIKLMIVRVVPDGDERDKDVANGIRYAIENGAKVINMSFGKGYSPQKKFVDEVLPLAQKYDVLLVHAAGNDSEDNDTIDNFPTNVGPDNKLFTNNWITVGASSMKADKNLAANFSNYGHKTVDVFAPGVDLWGLEPGNRYGTGSGTSMASPVVAGVAAVIRSYYPELTAAEVKDIIIKSAVKYDGKVKRPSEMGTGGDVNFSELSVSGGVVNLYNAIKMAEEVSKTKSTKK